MGGIVGIGTLGENALEPNHCGFDLNLVTEIRQRAVHIEDKVNELLRRSEGSYLGSPNQRYGHLSYSQHGEDMVFIAMFENMGILSPTFLDIGANHPVECSNTMLLRSRCGSKGVNIDANPDVIKIFDHDRPDDVNVNIGVAGKAGELTFYRFDQTSGLNSFSKAAMENIIAGHPNLRIMDELKIPVLTLDSIIDTYCGGVCPDLLSIDAEGFDYEILEAATFNTKPRILCVETLSGAGNNADILVKLVESKGFKKYITMFANTIFVRVDENI